MKRPKRTNTSKAMISQALLRLMQTTPYEQINISDICTDATVSRNTFYRNFTGKDAVLDEYLLQKCNYIIREFEKNETYNALMPTNEDLLRGYTRFYAFWYEHRDLVRLLVKCRLQSRLQSALSAVMVNPYSEQWVNLLQSSSRHLSYYYYNWLTASLCSILFSWADHDFDLPPKTVAGMLVQISSSVTERTN